jgi:Arc/MetJ-type ribon-helix-helix transcriptional regulator
MDNKTFNISMPKALLDAIDKQAEVEFRNRSDLIREAVRTYITQKGGMNMADKLTSDEVSRIRDSLGLSELSSKPAIILSCAYRSQPNSIKNIFTAGSPAMKLVEQPPKIRNMGWDLDTLDRARPIAGNYLEVKNGERKLLRLYRDGQHTFSAGMDFFGHGVNRDREVLSNFNLLSIAELITNFVSFSRAMSENLEKSSTSSIFTIIVSNPQPERHTDNKKALRLSAYDGMFTDDAGELNLEWAERNIVIKVDDNLSIERVAYLIYSEFCYFFGVRSDELWYVNKDTQEINKEVFLKAGR